MQVGMVLEGEGTLTSESHQIHIKPGDTFLFPASLKQVSWQPVGTQRILLGTLPN
jgi:mannose-6-phosphate isomerase-like protein (cupin superfamily)